MINKLKPIFEKVSKFYNSESKSLKAATDLAQEYQKTMKEVFDEIIKETGYSLEVVFDEVDSYDFHLEYNEYAVVNFELVYGRYVEDEVRFRINAYTYNIDSNYAIVDDDEYGEPECGFSAVMNYHSREKTYKQLGDATFNKIVELTKDSINNYFDCLDKMNTFKKLVLEFKIKAIGTKCRKVLDTGDL